MNLRAACLAPLLCLLACGEDETPRDLEVSIGTARVSARMDLADGLAELDITAELEATVDLEGATVGAVSMTVLPDGPEIEFAVSVRGPQDALSLDLPAGDIVVARITNAGTTNAELLPFCGRAASVAIVVEVEGLERSASRDITVGCS